MPDQVNANGPQSYWLIGRGASLSDRAMSFHIPSYGDYSNMGNKPYFKFAKTGDIPLMTLDAEGKAYISSKLGIGTSSPAATLDIRGKSLVQNSLGTNDYTYIGQHNGQFRIANGLGPLNSRALEIALLDNGTGVIQSNEFGVGYNSLSLNPVHGYVGIGTINPQTTLHVSGRARVDHNVKIFGSDETWAEGITIVKPSGWSGLRLTRNDPASGNFEGNWAIGYSAGSGNDLSITNYFNSTQSDYIFHISSSTKNIGIGTANPTAKLSVNGNIRAKEIKVEAAPWPDYVFSSSYKLPSLLETEQFIKANHHLPDIPSAAEVEKEGISLGEMNAKLLKKIEELTLQLIEVNKKLDSHINSTKQ
jgi:hypothetical protein